MITTQREQARTDAENKDLTDLALKGLQLLSSWNTCIMELVCILIFFFSFFFVFFLFASFSSFIYFSSFYSLFFFLFFFFFFFPGLSHHLGSPVQLINCFLHSALFATSSPLIPAIVMFLLHSSIHCMFGLPFLLFPGISSSTLLNMCSSSLLGTWP